MSLLNGNSRFSLSAQKDIQRSVFDRSNTLVTSFSAGKLIPIYVDEVLPGDTVTMDMSSLVRMSTPLYPVMDNAYIDFHWFFVPNRLVWKNWKYFMGETREAWDEETIYEIPVDRPFLSDGSRSVYDYFGLPVSQSEAFAPEVNALFRRGYQLIWNEWYRDQSLQDAILIDTGDFGIDSSDTSIGKSFALLPVNKYKDYFTSALPQPQRGADVMFPAIPGDVPVIATAEKNDLTGKFAPISLCTSNGNALYKGNYQPLIYSTSLNAGSTNKGTTYLNWDASATETNMDAIPLPVSIDNLHVAFPHEDFTINALRQAFAIQRLLETDARGGTRYKELVKAHFGVDVGDSRIQVPEYLGGAHVPINVNQVIQQSSTSQEPSPLGETGAFSKTVHSSSMFTKSFVEHGMIFCLASVRTDHSYSQGIHRMWSRRTRLDYYWPELANIGEQAILNKELYATGESADNEVFGYQEAYAEYRYRPNMITGQMRHVENAFMPGRSDNYSVWHYGDYYRDRPYLSDEWIRETPENIARTLAVYDESLSDQFFADFYFKARWARPMPLYSIPSLSGHF